MYYLLLFYLIILRNNVSIEATTSDQYDALCTMVSSMPLLHNAKYGWTPCPTSDACNWNIVVDDSGTLNCTGGNVTAIDLSETQIGGTIPTQIGELIYLTFLDMSQSKIEGTIPTQIGQLIYLTFLSFYSTQISGTIPTQLLQITYLQTLALSNNQLSGTIPTQIGQLKYLTYLDFSSTQISGTIPSQLSQITYLQTLNLPQNTQLCGCPILPPNLTYSQCNLQGTSYSCNCSTLSTICQVSGCSRSFNCLQGSSPQPMPSIQSTPHPSPNVGSSPLSIPSIKPTPYPSPNVGSSPLSIPSIKPTPQPRPSPNVGSSPLSIPSIQSAPHPSPNVGNSPLSIPSIQSTPQPRPSPNVGCQGNYGTIFTCKDGKWISSTDVVLNGTNLLYSTFNLTNLFVNENMLISGSNINIQNLFIQKNSELTIENCSISVSGNLYIDPLSTIVLDTNNNFTVNIEHCVFLDGILIINTHQSQIGKMFPIFNSQCTNGTFSSVFVNLTNIPQCNVVVPHLEYLQNTLSVSFDLINQCNSVQSWIYIVIGIAALLLLISIIGTAIVIRRNFKIRNNTLNAIGQQLARMRSEN